MTNRVSNRAPTSALFPEKPKFRVLIVYEDLPAGLQARRVYENLNHSLQQDCEFNYDMWKLDALEIPRLSQLAAEEAAEADMVILSGHGRLTQLLKEWVSEWLPHRGEHKKALVAVLDIERERHPETVALRDYLEEVARKGEMDFFPYFARMQSIPSRTENSANIPPRTDSNARYDYSCWGLNE